MVLYVYYSLANKILINSKTTKNVAANNKLTEN